jgi:hypothetical protein
MVSPGRGKLSLKVVRSVFALPMTAMRANLAMHSPERGSRGKNILVKEIQQADQAKNGKRG